MPNFPGFIWFPKACGVEEEALVLVLIKGIHPRLAIPVNATLPHAVQSIWVACGVPPRRVHRYVVVGALLVTLRDAASASWIGFFVVRAWITRTLWIARLQLHALVLTLLCDRCGAALPRWRRGWRGVRCRGWRGAAQVAVGFAILPVSSGTKARNLGDKPGTITITKLIFAASLQSFDILRPRGLEGHTCSLGASQSTVAVAGAEGEFANVNAGNFQAQLTLGLTLLNAFFVRLLIERLLIERLLVELLLGDSCL